MTKHTARALALAAALLAAAGCASTGTEKNLAPIPMPAPIPTATQAALAAVAQNYQDAANHGDWQTACTLSSALLRGGTVADCVTTRTTPPPTATPVKPPTYADGSTPAGPVTAGANDIIRVPAGPGTHPAGYGAFVTFPRSTPEDFDHRALRLVEEDGAWVVDQSEEFVTEAAEVRRVLLRRHR
ncbi:hypothetical protein ABZW10_24565 [Kitasatospora sp. NPDC004723]|uniref:hypothetical protein n=1 Tax=Kitasatospora sp. NPDC004723 TaxID=3154288 RepID=UPI0033B5F742